MAVVPPVALMYGQREPLAAGLPALLSTETVLGRQMRRVGRRLVDWEVEGGLKLRQGPPLDQIRREMVEGEYDLLAVTTTPCTWWRRCLESDLLADLLHTVTRPMLIARPARA
jgi:hypothetical protein